MAILIDGYNLLHASGILGRGRGPGYLERARQALLNCLAESLDEKEVSRCTVVFDASDSAEGVAAYSLASWTYRSVRVWIAEADELIEQLIQADTSPRKLIVVSSDHRLQRAAKRRKATPIDSDEWFRATIRQRMERSQTSDLPLAKPPPPSTDAEIQFWLRAFEVEMSDEDDDTRPSESPESPFPPGYGDDVCDES